MSDIIPFFPTAGSLVEGDKIIITKKLNLTGVQGIPFGETGTVLSTTIHGELVILSIEVEGSFTASVIPSDTEVELKTPF